MEISLSTSEQSESNKDIKQEYSLRNFTFKLQTSPKDKSFQPDNDVIYHNQWTQCSAAIVDESRKPVASQKTVEISSESDVDFSDSRIKKGHLHFSMKSNEIGEISIFIKVDNCTLTETFCVTCNPCSSHLSEMTIDKIDSSNAKFLYRVFIFDVFGEPVNSDSPENCQLEANFQSIENKVESEEMHIAEDGQKCYNIEVSGDRPWSQDFNVLLNGEPVRHAEKFEFTEKECRAVNHLNDKDYEWMLKDFDEDDYGLSIPLSTGEDDGKYVAYDENDFEVQSQNANSHQLICRNVRKCDLLPRANKHTDFAHIDNIKRVLQIKDHVEIKETPGQRNAIIVLRNIPSHRLPISKDVVQHLLRGLYYRRQASQAARIRMEWKDRIINIEDVLLLHRSPSVVLCKYFRDFFGDLLNEYNRKACDELFKFFNFQRDESEVDLHGLLVADESKLRSLRFNLLFGSLSEEQIYEVFKRCKITCMFGHERQTLRKKLRNPKVKKVVNDIVAESLDENSATDSKRREDVDEIIERCRLEGDEAIRKLKKTLEDFGNGLDHENESQNNSPWLEIIVGAGHHSRIKNEQNIRPKVEKHLKKRNLKFTAVNKGSLVVTFKTYSGPEPCFGEYYCKNCNRCWRSSKSYVGKYQKCSKCEVDCWPVKQREKEKVANYRRDGAKRAKRKSKPHQSSLCQKCKELGRLCSNKQNYQDSV